MPDQRTHKIETGKEKKHKSETTTKKRARYAVIDKGIDKLYLHILSLSPCKLVLSDT